MTALSVLVAFALLMPLVLAAAMLWRPARPIAARLACWAAVPALLLALQPPATYAVDWLQLGTVFGTTALTRPLLLVTAVLWLAAAHFSRGYLAHDPGRTRFDAFFLLTFAGNVGLIIARDVPGFYLFFALMTFAAYGLVIHAGSAEAHRAGRVYIALAVLGEALLIVGLALAVQSSGSLMISDVPAGIAASPYRSATIALLLAGFGVKAGMLGLHMWLPLAHPIAPTPASAVLSGAMIKAGLLGWLQFLPLDPAASGWLAPVAAWGLAAAFFGVALGLVQRDPKATLAYSSMSQMGLMLVAVALGFSGSDGNSPSPSAAVVALYYAAHHGLAKAALFLGVGVIGATAVGSAHRTVVLLLLAIPALALVGAPWTSGASAKALLETQLAAGSSGAPAWIKPGLTWAAVGTGLLMARVLWQLRGVSQQSERATLRIYAAWFALVAGSAFAVAGLPWAFTLSVPLPDPAGSALPLAIALALSLIAWRFAHRQWTQWHLPPGDVLVLIELHALQRWLAATVNAISLLVLTTWQSLVRGERRLRRRWTIAVGREEIAFPLAAGACVMSTLTVLLLLLTVA